MNSSSEIVALGTRTDKMKVSALSLLLFFISAALVMASLIGFFRPTPPLSQHSYELMAAGYGILFLGLIFKGNN